MSDKQFWKSTPAKIHALADLKYPRAKAKPKSDVNTPYQGAQCDSLSVRAAFKGNLKGA